ncbi:MAG: hypothetical protein KDC80_20875 [Saprospiraceae bacterium]|nr:hypothetical protein [Saprospiraceae bacterium]
MKILWNKALWVERYLVRLKRQKSHSEKFLEVIPGLKEEVQLQSRVNVLVKHYHRKKLREELESISSYLLSDPSKKDFQRKIFQIFK